MFDMTSLTAHLLTYPGRYHILAVLCCFVAVAGLSYGAVAVQPAAPNSDTVTTVTATSSSSEVPLIRITVTDSTGATANATTPITITAGGPARFDTDDSGTIERGEAIDAISAFNGGNTVGGEPVTRGDAIDVISAFNSGESVGA
jgi:hypothetical protein